MCRRTPTKQVWSQMDQWFRYLSGVRPFSRAALAAALLSAVLTGCGSSSQPPGRPTAGGANGTNGYETVAKDPRRDADLARRENSRGVALLDAGDYAGAEAAFKAALSADETWGPAHNNLGKVYFHQHKLYLAASEFQRAAAFMPRQPEPLDGLGSVYEIASKWDVKKLNDAIESYRKAMDLEPDNPQFIGNLARARIRRGDRDEEVVELLRRLLLRDTRPQWAEWANGQLARLTRPRGSEEVME